MTKRLDGVGSIGVSSFVPMNARPNARAFHANINNNWGRKKKKKDSTSIQIESEKDETPLTNEDDSKIGKAKQAKEHVKKKSKKFLKFITSNSLSSHSSLDLILLHLICCN